MNIKNILTKIIPSDLHLYFFYGFILSIPFQIRKGFLTEHSYFAGGFSEYATFFVYFSDVLLILTLFFWVVKICKNMKISIGTKFCAPTTLNLRFLIKNKSLTLLLLFCLWLVVDLLLISGNYFSISAYQTLKFLELAALFAYVYFNLTSFKRILITVGLLTLSGLTQAFLAISQYLLQRSVFGSKWFGEIVLSPELSGVAKIVADGENIMRAYGTFPHPNILAGFLLLTIFLSWYLLTNYPQFINNAGKNKSFSLFGILRKIKDLILRNKLDNLSSKDGLCRFCRDGFQTRPYNRINNVSYETLLFIFFTFLIFIQILALILTFSRSGWLGFFVILFVLVVFYFLKIPPLKKGVREISGNVSRETISESDNFLGRDGFKTRPYGRIDNVSHETLSNRLKNLIFNKNALSILFLAVLTIFSIIYFLPEISSRNLSEKSLVGTLVGTGFKPIPTAGNATRYEEKLYDYPKNVSRETFLKSDNLRRDGFQTRPYERIKNVSHETLSDSENKEREFPSWEGLETGYFANLENQNRDSAITDRLFYNKVAIDSINKYPFTGTGLGSFIFQIDNYLNVSRETLLESVGTGLKPVPAKNNPRLEFWRYQPAHNIYLLIASEIGIIGFLIFAFFVVQVCRDGFQTRPYNHINNVSRETLPDNSSPPCEKEGGGRFRNFTNLTHFLKIPLTPFYKGGIVKRGIINNVSRETFDISRAQRNLQHFLIAIFIGFLAIGLFDHYFWTLQQGRLEFWLVLALIATNGKNNKK